MHGTGVHPIPQAQDSAAPGIQIPNNITLDYAATAGTATSADYATDAGDADTLDSFDSSAATGVRQ